VIRALPRPRGFDPELAPALGWGIVGTGWVARAFARALASTGRQRVEALSARDPERTRALAAQLGVARAYLSTAQLVADPAVDVVYVATPHSTHRDIALEAIAAGKHVLIEKPLAVTAAQGRQIAQAAERAGVLVMEAMWTQYLPHVDISRQLIADGVLGDIQLVNADFGLDVPRDLRPRIWDSELGGGALLEMGVYPLSFCVSLIGEPVRISATGLVQGEVDTHVAVQLTTANAALGQLATSITAELPGRADVVGTAARIEVAAPFHAPTSIRVIPVEHSAAPVLEWSDPTAGDPTASLALQATALAGYVGEGRTESAVYGLDSSVAVLDIIDEARRQCGLQTEIRT
jgi:predicted dehydrogenase